METYQGWDVLMVCLHSVRPVGSPIVPALSIDRNRDPSAARPMIEADSFASVFVLRPERSDEREGRQSFFKFRQLLGVVLTR